MTVPLIQAVLDAVGELDRERLGVLLAEQPELVNAEIDGVTPLHLAAWMVTDHNALPARDGGPDAHAVVDDLLAAGADTDRPAIDGYTPLHAAGFCGNDGLVAQLLAAGADPQATVNGVPGSTPLSFALFYGHRPTAALLAEGVRAPDDLRSAAGLNDVDGVARLLSPDGALVPGADAGMAFTAPIDAFPPRIGPITDQLTIDESLTWAARNASVDAMELLVARGADVNANPYRGTALLWAVYREQAEVLQWLIDHGAEVNLRHDFGGAEHGHMATALHLAGQQSGLASIDVLLAAGADRTITDAAFNATPAGWAEHNGQTEAAERLRLA